MLTVVINDLLNYLVLLLVQIIELSFVVKVFVYFVVEYLCEYRVCFVISRHLQG